MAAVGAEFGDEAYEYLTASVLEPSETIRWTGRAGGLACMARTWWTFTFGLLLGLFSGAGAVATSGEVGFVGLLVTGPFVLASVHFLSMPLQYWLLAANTVYAITDRRVIVLAHFCGMRTQSYFAEDVRYFETIDRGSDRGSIRLRFSSVFLNPFAMTDGLYLRGGLWGIERLSDAVRAIQRFKMADWEE